jgi:NitT/TauT family transport system substrate-binding protein
MVIIIVLVIIGLVILLFGMPAPVMYQGDLPPLVISSGSPEFSTLTLIADEKGFFTKYGLNVTVKEYPTGPGAVRDLLSGESDIACAAEFVGVVLLDTSPELKIIGSTAKSDAISFVIRNDRGIASPKDLKGKTIAVPEGTPDDLVMSIVAGQVDGAVIWEPYVYSIQQQMKTNATTWPAQSGQLFYWVTYTREDIINDRPDMLVRYFRALSDARQYLIQNEPDGKAIIMQRVNLSDEYIDTIWQKTRFSLSFDQSMIIAMEDEERWRIKNNLTNTNSIPNYLDSVSTESLRAVRPESVNIIE